MQILHFSAFSATTFHILYSNTPSFCFLVLEDYVLSLKSMDNGIPHYCCTHCSYSTPYKGNLKSHLITHSTVRPYVCQVCNKTFNQKGTLKRHFRLHSGERPYKCDICQRTFAQSYALTYHKKTHAHRK